ncbi:uncharacterized protein LOC130728048 [Lotus japonicus]|uniref:uncharacterized protein LOC130728048 n=1 Tax=Lotus japonicus TaxID=34305 RepID=UPI002590CBAE|nr:uncharacterized protein LOC130728048 [Lotus japonicus]
MCILCVIQKCSRRVATMLPWLVVPLIGLWALSQLLPPAFRFEITSPRLGCVLVLLGTLFWYEILMPQLSAWRARRNARIRERKRFEAIEMQKLRKTATRRCRNCLNPYKDQNPGGGRFMCSYCGHVSKRPVLDLPVPISNSGIVKDLVGKSGKILNSKVWCENGWMCSQEWLENSNWVGGSILGNPSKWRMNGNAGIFRGDEHCLTERSYSSLLVFVCNLLTYFFLSIRWLWRKACRISSREGSLSDAEHRALLAKQSEDGVSLNESRGEKARRKAEEKRQARIEKELLEEEERKQREEVARLVEERRRLRDEKMEAERDRSKSLHPSKEKDSKKEAAKKRQEKRRDKDKGSSKSNSDVEELEKKAGKEGERKRDFDKKGEKSETDRREYQKSGSESGKGQSTNNAHGKNVATNSYNRGSSGTRYLDRMRGTILSSSKAFGFGRGANVPTTVVKESKLNSSVDHVHTAASRRGTCPPDLPMAKSNLNGDDRNTIHSVLPEPPQAWTEPKKSWQQLFTRSSSVPKSSSSNVICRPNSKSQEAKSPPLSGQLPFTESFNNPIQFGLQSPFNVSAFPNGSTSCSLGFTPAIEPLFSPVKNPSHDFRHEEQELFEDPCYVPDPVSLLGPVFESLDNFQLDLGSGFPHSSNNPSIGSDVHKPSPIESPLSREKHSYSNQFQSTPQAQDTHAFPMDGVSANEKGTWQMWSSSPLVQESLGLVGGSGSWLLSSQRNLPNYVDSVLPSPQKTIASVFDEDNSIISSTHSPQNIFLPNGRKSGGTISPITCSSGYEPWLQQSTFFPQLSSCLKAQESAQNEMIYRSPSGSASSRVHEFSPAKILPKNEWPVHGSVESVGKSSSVSRPHDVGVHPTSDAKSFWLNRQ